MGNWRSDPPGRQDLAARASPEPRMPTEEEKRHIAEVHKRSEKERKDMRTAGFGDHKGVEGS